MMMTADATRDAATKEEVKGYQRLRSSRQMTFLSAPLICCDHYGLAFCLQNSRLFDHFLMDSKKTFTLWSMMELSKFDLRENYATSEAAKNNDSMIESSYNLRRMCALQFYSFFYRRMQVVGPSSSAWTTSTNSSEFFLRRNTSASTRICKWRRLLLQLFLFGTIHWTFSAVVCNAFRSFVVVALPRIRRHIKRRIFRLYSISTIFNFLLSKHIPVQLTPFIMKFLIAFAALVAVCLAAPLDDSKNAQILKYENDNIGLGGYSYA